MGPFVTRIRDHEIHAIEEGSGDRVLLLLHGLSGSSRWWHRNIPELSRHYRVLVPDLIGFGRSRPIGRFPEIKEVALLLLEWLEILGVERTFLVGHSMGGQISLHIAAESSSLIERLVVADATGIPRALSLGALLRFGAEVGPLWRWGDPSFLPVIAADAWNAGPRVLLRAMHRILKDDVRPILGKIEVPTLIVWGERDTLVPPSDALEFRRSIKGARLAVLRATGHNPMVDRPDDFNRLVHRFLQGDPVGR
jgi:pimeloyl-ACP methyl ester carboxylesterase